MIKIGLSFFALAIFIFPASSLAETFSGSLKYGDKSDEVLKLQRFLNSIPETVVAYSGAGSSGQETEFFGPATMQAVIRFQEKHKDEILSPIGLSRGTGFVGAMTLKKINSLLLAKAQNASGAPGGAVSNQGSQTQNQQSSGAGVPSAPSTSSPMPNANPNYAYLDDMLKAIWQVGKEQNYSEADLVKAETAVRQTAATSTDLMKLFAEQMANAGAVSYSLDPYNKDDEVKDKGRFGFFGGVVEKIAGLFTPKEAVAFIGLPFGGRILGATLCTCSGNWLMFLMPTPPSFVVLMTHYMGMQGFLRYNVPFAMHLLGKYIPGGAPCMMYAGIICVPIPAQGMTTPLLGSA